MSMHTIAMFGHNPGFTDFANYLTDADIYNIPTSGVVVISFDVDDWAEISHHSGKVLLFDFPKSTEEPQSKTSGVSRLNHYYLTA